VEVSPELATGAGSRPAPGSKLVSPMASPGPAVGDRQGAGQRTLHADELFGEVPLESAYQQLYRKVTHTPWTRRAVRPDAGPGRKREKPLCPEATQDLVIRTPQRGVEVEPMETPGVPSSGSPLIFTDQVKTNGNRTLKNPIAVISSLTQTRFSGDATRAKLRKRFAFPNSHPSLNHVSTFD